MARKKLTVHRKAYTRKDGTRVKAATFQVKDVGAPGKGKKLFRMKPGGLGGPGYLTASERMRHQRLNASVKKDGVPKTMHRLIALSVLGKRTRTTAEKRTLQKDRDWLSDKYGK